MAELSGVRNRNDAGGGYGAGGKQILRYAQNDGEEQADEGRKQILRWAGALLRMTERGRVGGRVRGERAGVKRGYGEKAQKGAK